MNDRTCVDRDPLRDFDVSPEAILVHRDISAWVFVLMHFVGFTCGGCIVGGKQLMCGISASQQGLSDF